MEPVPFEQKERPRVEVHRRRGSRPGCPPSQWSDTTIVVILRSIIVIEIVIVIVANG